MGKVKLSLASWNRFITRNLSIHPKLVGAEHQFLYGNHKIIIKLPSLPKNVLENKLLTLTSYREKNDKKIPIEYFVHSIDLTVSIPKKELLPKEILDKSPNQFEIFSEKQQEYLNQLAETHQAVAQKAYDLWLRTLRWKSDNSTIGRPEIKAHESHMPACLITTPSEQRIWNAPMRFIAKGGNYITPQIWQEAEKILISGETPPTFVDLIMDAEEHIKLGDLSRAIVDMAIACEIFLRLLVSRNLPKGLQNSIEKFIDEVNIRPVLEKFVPDILKTKQLLELKKIKSHLHKLFDERNNIVHKGNISTLTVEKSNKYLQTAKRLITI